MTTDSNPVGTPVPAAEQLAIQPIRLQLDPGRPVEPYLDGAWWPRSTELSVELPKLLAALDDDLGPIALVGYHRDAWNAAPHLLHHGGRVAHLEGFVSLSPPTVIVIADTGRCVSLRVVPPDTDDATASRVMTTAARHRVEPPTAASAVERRSLEEVAARLARLPGNTDREHVTLISGWVDEAADQFDDAPVQAFVPILVEHIVRDRLAVSRAKGLGRQ